MIRQAPPEVGTTQSAYDALRRALPNGCTPINLALGIPHLKPPPSYYRAMAEVAKEVRESPVNSHGYLTTGDPFGLCKSLARQLEARLDLPFHPTDILVTAGATGALDTILETLTSSRNSQKWSKSRQTSPMDILVIEPHSVEYLNIIRSHGARAVPVPASPNFDLDCRAIADAITPRTRAILINSPNNPTGTIYPRESLEQLSAILLEHSAILGHKIALIEDAVYESIVFTGIPPPSAMPFYPQAFRIDSFSKSLGLGAERLGYLAVHPEYAKTRERSRLIDDLNLSQRIRSAQAPALQHRIVARMTSHGPPDLERYRQNLTRLHLTLSMLGFGVRRPQATFYLWAELPPVFATEPDFHQIAKRGPSPLMYLPGRLFGGESHARHIRFATCVPWSEIERACTRLHEIVAAARPDPASLRGSAPTRRGSSSPHLRGSPPPRDGTAPNKSGPGSNPERNSADAPTTQGAPAAA